MTMKPLIPVLAALALAACAGGPAPIEVTRFHLSQPLAGQTIAVVPPEGVAADSLDFATQASALAAELARAGFQPVAAGQPSMLRATLRLESSSREEQRQSPFSIGIGGMTGGRNVGVGGGVAVPVGGNRTRTVTMATLSLQIRRTADGSVQWEGRASDTVDGSNAIAAVPRLARALLTGFPGPSGQTVRVKPAP
ncbi:DUF4136 domain-containing protein [Sandarakinorhabdus rubra]|uniref:DUF4136 domain-containing protein n=1 Tax=Sandarakinorhabdus rubra TaxID=2672568 RepID=UPI0013DD6B6B|nr:DUF4136 domain-containing protein [Sandarakinorhabdus rubra]